MLEIKPHINKLSTTPRPSCHREPRYHIQYSKVPPHSCSQTYSSLHQPHPQTLTVQHPADQFIPSSVTATSPCPSQTPTSAHPMPALAAQFTQSAACPPVIPSSLEPAHCRPAPLVTPAIDWNGMQVLISLLDQLMAPQNVQGAASSPVT